jgi:hypothetical protein
MLLTYQQSVILPQMITKVNLWGVIREATLEEGCTY